MSFYGISLSSDDIHTAAVKITSADQSFSCCSCSTFKYNVQVLGVPLCNYVNHFSTASLGAPCTYEGFRRLDMSDSSYVLPNNGTENMSEWSVKVWKTQSGP